MQRVRKQLGCTDEVLNRYDGGKGITIAMLDTGIAVHPDFDHKLLLFKDFVNHQKTVYDDCGHGTHVAGCMSGNGKCSGGDLKGIAPETNLVVGKVLDKNGDGQIGNMVAGLEWVLENKDFYQIKILNISIGTGKQLRIGKISPLLSLVTEACRQGIIVVCAAGNNGPGEMTLSPIGSLRDVITVGCHEGGYFGEREDLCEHYSGCGPSIYDIRKPDIVAPGTQIFSCNAFFSKRGKHLKNAYIAKSGTSMSTPIVSGAVALLLKKNPQMKAEEVKRKLQLTSLDLKEPWYKQGCGLIQINSLLT
ncbi:MAG: S8 family peptidase [Lachnospiraceae bacterium]|nr:S8 family peptidase [Lachnospiraceae bacterium]